MQNNPEIMKREIICHFQNTVDGPPVSAEQLHKNACQNDEITISSWKPTWKRNVQANHEKFGPFWKRSIGHFFEKYKNQTCIIAGSGPSLKFNAELLKDRKGIPLVSCLHNFHYFEDLGLEPEFYVSLDAGEVTVEEVTEGGTKSEEEYWEKTKHRKLLAYIATSPKLLEKWRGEIYFYNAPVPDPEYNQFCENIERFPVYLSTGGCVLGACLYFAKGFLGCEKIIFTGADFSFSGMNKFHSWDSKYDAKLGHCLRVTDIFGNKVNTWQSYYNFKQWFDQVAITAPGTYVNATEGGCLGAYDIGNIKQIQQTTLRQALLGHSMTDQTRSQAMVSEHLAAQPDESVKRLLF